MRNDQIALQLYTVRRLLAEDLPGTLEAVARASYGSVELAGLPPTDTATLARALAGAGLRVVSAHESRESRRAGVEWYIVEQDEPREPLVDIERGLRHLAGLAA